MGKRTFHGGVHPYEGKHYTEKKAIEPIPNPAKVFIPLQQHIGAPAEVLVKKGDEVKKGQKIAEAKGFVSTPIHSSVSGVVKSIEEINHPVSGKGMAVVIENDGNDTWSEEVKERSNYLELDGKEIVNIVREAGIAGMGGATFPTHVKLSPPPDKKIDVVILNGAECEPYLTADHRLMLEKSREIVFGLQLLMKALNVNRGIIGIEDNKPDAVEAMKKASANVPGVEVMDFPVKYPQGAEKQLIKAAVDREVPAGGLPMDVGVVVQNVGTAFAVYEAVALGRPLIERVVTVTGPGIKDPKNVLVPIGTPFEDVVNYCGGLTENAAKIIMGGPMMGLTQPGLDVPVVKGTSGILVFEEEQSHLKPENPCIGCARCVEVCPMNLLPTTLQQLVEHDRILQAEQYHIMDCIECGSCSYICPANRYLLQAIRHGKRQVIKSRRKAG
ncbi:MAG: electron transport complex subunit RsxC [Calditrichia bacterium]